MRGVPCQRLLESDIFLHHLEDDNWPEIHFNDSESISHYNGSLFDIRGSYYNTFSSLGTEEEYIKEMNKEDNKVYKIKYTLNLLPTTSE
jgi:hypothetical protein